MGAAGAPYPALEVTMHRSRLLIYMIVILITIGFYIYVASIAKNFLAYQTTTIVLNIFGIAVGLEFALLIHEGLNDETSNDH